MYNAEEKRCGHYLESDVRGAAFAGGDNCAPEGILECVTRFRTGHSLAFCSLDIMQDDENRFYIVDLNITPFCRDGNADDVRFLQTGESPRLAS